MATARQLSMDVNKIMPSVSPSILNWLPLNGGLDDKVRQQEISWKLPGSLSLPAPLPLSVPTGSVPSLNHIGDGVAGVPDKQAARMIVIRRRKMKKHKLQKLRKRRKFEYRRVAQRREALKEKEFQMKLLARVREAESFDPHSYVMNIIQKAKEDLTVERPHFNAHHKHNPAINTDRKSKYSTAG